MALALTNLPPIQDDRILVGTNTADDAGVIRINDELALVQTVDVFSPVVDDPYTFGRIAAINSMSDVYAMGGTPISALNVAGFPGGMDPKILGEILHGGQDAAIEAGVAMLGGHTFQDSEIKFGLSVTGLINPAEIYSNSNARPGDLLILTKPLGTGTIIQAMVTRGVVSESVYRSAVKSMTTSNLAASVSMKGLASACTDITGFGLLGHSWEMAEGSNVGFELNALKLPLLPSVIDLIRDGVLDSGCKQNRNSFENYASFSTDVPVEYETLLYSSETSGGLLIAVPESKSDQLLANLEKAGSPGVVVGFATSEHRGLVCVSN